MYGHRLARLGPRPHDGSPSASEPVGKACLPHGPNPRARRPLLTLCKPIRQTVQVCKDLVVGFAVDIGLQHYVVAKAIKGVIWLWIGRVVGLNMPPFLILPRLIQ